MRISRRLAAATVVAAVPLLAGCGSSGTTTTPNATPTTAVPSTTATTAAPAPVAPSTVPPATTAPSGAAGATAWLTYHGDASRTGAVPAGPSLDPARTAWTADLGAAVFGQPLAFQGRVYAATEGDEVYALDAATGKVAWSTSIGAPLTHVASVAGCGDIDPLGITSTPVIDAATGTIYVVGEVAANGAVHHQLVGLRLSDGAVEVSDPVDPPLPAGERAVTLLQRDGLALANGRVYVGFGGNDGDCGDYHGWVVGVAVHGPADLVSFEVAPDGMGGAIWQSGGAPAVGPSGQVFVSTGNANPDPPQGGPDPKRYTESVVELNPALQPLASYKDEVAGGDEDLSTGNPVLLPDGDVFAVGKTDIAYVLSQRSLAVVATIHGVCGSNPDGGPAYDQATNRMFVPCSGGGVQVVDLADDTLGPRLAGADSSPIVVGGDVWALDYPGGTAYEYDASTLKTLQSVSVSGSVPNFSSPSTAGGLLLVPTDRGVTALAGPGGVGAQPG